MSNNMVYVQLLMVLIAANGAPILGRLLMKNYWNTPIDLGNRFMDGRPWLGPSKTYRGVFFGMAIAGLMAQVVALPFEIGVLVGALAMSGDCLSSFVKRRFGLSSEAMALGLDQIPESLIPLVGMKSVYGLSWSGIGLTVGAFLILELGFSLLLFKFDIRKHPY